MIQNALKLFFKQKRFDLIFKWLFLKNPENTFNKIAYLENIRAFNNFYELNPSDGVKKEGADEFINRFINLFKSISKNGYNEEIGIIPIGKNGEINDGGHRLICSALLGLDVVLENNNLEELYNYNFFNNMGMDKDIMDYGALEYVKLNPNAYIVNLHSVTPTDKDDIVEDILNKYGFIFYKKDINLTFNGYVNLKKISYGSFWEKESWIGDVTNKFAGAQAHAKASMGKSPLRVFIFVCDDLNKVIKAKEEIRTLYNIGNYSVHINDYREEAIWLAETYFNKNSLYMINNRCFYYEDYRFDNLIENLKNIAIENNINLENICASGSTPMDIAGIRKSDDLDFLYCGNKEFNLETETLSNHSSELKYYPYNEKEIIQNPKNHFYYHGLKFITLDILLSMKEKRKEKPKDIKDCKKIKNYLKNKKMFKINFKFFQKIKSRSKRKIIIFGFIKINYKKRNTEV